MKISDNFNLDEFTKSDTAYTLGIDNNPTEGHIENLIKLVENVLQPLREALDIPIDITSGYRSKALNEAIKGSKTSQHCKGQAADIVFKNMDKMFDWLVKNLDYDQIILENSNGDQWIHVSYVSPSKNRLQALVYNGNKYQKYGA